MVVIILLHYAKIDIKKVMWDMNISMLTGAGEATLSISQANKAHPGGVEGWFN